MSRAEGVKSVEAKRHIYIVDDDFDMRTSLFYALTVHGYEVRSSGSGQDFLDDADGLKPGCVLLDIRMPGLNGLQVIEALGERVNRLPVVVMTGHGDLAMAVKAMKLGGSDFIEKPFGVDHLLSVVERIFAKLETSMSDVARRLDAVERIAMLSDRERDILLGLATGMSNKVIAYEIGLSVRTVEKHRTSLMRRLQVRSLPAALDLAELSGFVASRAWSGNK